MTNRNSRCMAFVILGAACCPVAAQESLESLDTRNTCSYSGGLSPGQVRTFASDAEAVGAVRKIVEATGLVQNFEVRAAGVANAAAAIDGARRYLLYNQTFIHDMRAATGTDWSAISVMAHEIGHHLNNHTLDPRREVKFEIEADYFSGFWLQKLGATLQESQSALNYLPSAEGSSTHPPKHDRLAAVANGWSKACEADPGCGRSEAAPVKREENLGKRIVQKPGPDSCEHARDGECDEPTLCDPGTDTADCSYGPNSCEYALDGECDEPNPCQRGTDTSDCQQPSTLYCCDMWGNRWCQITFNPQPPGSACFCAGVPGTGIVCR